MKPFESGEGTLVVPGEQQDAGQTRDQDRLPMGPVPGGGQ